MLEWMAARLCVSVQFESHVSTDNAQANHGRWEAGHVAGLNTSFMRTGTPPILAVASSIARSDASAFGGSRLFIDATMGDVDQAAVRGLLTADNQVGSGEIDIDALHALRM